MMLRVSPHAQLIHEPESKNPSHSAMAPKILRRTHICIRPGIRKSEATIQGCHPYPQALVSQRLDWTAAIRRPQLSEYLPDLQPRT